MNTRTLRYYYVESSKVLDKSEKSYENNAYVKKTVKFGVYL